MKLFPQMLIAVTLGLVNLPAAATVDVGPCCGVDNPGRTPTLIATGYDWAHGLVAVSVYRRFGGTLFAIAEQCGAQAPIFGGVSYTFGAYSHSPMDNLWALSSQGTATSTITYCQSAVFEVPLGSNFVIVDYTAKQVGFYFGSELPGEPKVFSDVRGQVVAQFAPYINPPALGQ